MKRTTPYITLHCLLWMLLTTVLPLQADGGVDVLNRILQLPRSKGTIYQLLGIVTEQSGFLFIYDSKIINNDQKTTLKAGDYSIREAIYQITGNQNLALRVLGNHILIQKSLPIATDSIPTMIPDSSRHFTVEGTLLDRYTKEPIAYASVGITQVATGTITNQNGMFRLRLPDSLRQATIQFAHIGYQSQEIASALLMGQYNQLTLEPKVVSLQEVVVRLVNPITLLKNMLHKREMHYARTPVYLTTFYREGIQNRKNLMNLTEAVFKVYKTSGNSLVPDQVKLLKKRRISNEYEKDTLLAKMKSGIDACLTLDLVKRLPDFLCLGTDNMYTYAHSDIAVVDDRLANVILFEQKKGTNLPLYRGEIFIDTENDALLRVRFEINPHYVQEAASLFVEKKSRNLSIIPQEIAYTVSYKPWNGIYYIHHVRGDLYFKVKKGKKLFNTTSLHTWFEMVTCKIDSTEVHRFTREERIPTRTIFSDTHFMYDANFWGNFNVILPEEKLNDAINKISSKIEFFTEPILEISLERF